MGLAKKKLATWVMIGSTLPMPMVTMASDAEVKMYPQHPITLVVGFPPGAATDTLARHLARNMAEELGQRVIVENRPGAAGNVGAAAVAHSLPDGYTIYLALSSATLHKQLYRQVNYDFAADLAPVGLAASAPYVLVMGKHVSARTLAEAIQLARDNPGKMTVASGGIGSVGHILSEAIQEAAGVRLTHVPYKGAVPALTDVQGGRADFMITTLPSVLAHLKADRVRGMAVLTKDRLAVVPELPAIAEYGFKDARGSEWFAVMAPTETPPYAIERLNRAINTVLGDEDIRAPLTQLGYVIKPESNTPEALDALIEQHTRRWVPLLEQHGITGVQ